MIVVKSDCDKIRFLSYFGKLKMDLVCAELYSGLRYPEIRCYVAKINENLFHITIADVAPLIDVATTSFKIFSQI